MSSRFIPHLEREQLTTSRIQFRHVDWGSPAYHDAIALRQKLLREPLALTFSQEEINAEADQLHFVALEQERVIATVVAKPISDTTVKLRQMAVAESWQRQGVGFRLLSFAESMLAEHGHQSFELHARITAEPFYQRAGYQSVGEPFIEVTLPHIKMVKKI